MIIDLEYVLSVVSGGGISFLDRDLQLKFDIKFTIVHFTGVMRILIYLLINLPYRGKNISKIFLSILLFYRSGIIESILRRFK